MTQISTGLSDEAPSIGIILCKEKNRTVVEYALHDANKPIGVATYTMVKELPTELKVKLRVIPGLVLGTKAISFLG